jgi:hypothetical protein
MESVLLTLRFQVSFDELGDFFEVLKVIPFTFWQVGNMATPARLARVPLHLLQPNPNDKGLDIGLCTYFVRVPIDHGHTPAG